MDEDLESAIQEIASRAPGVGRQWVSYGLVDAETEDRRSVTFDPDHGGAPLVDVTLHPSAVPVRCRVGGLVAGNGEAEYYPFVAGDEVVVAIPEGDERVGPVIIARLNSEIDVFPSIVAGADVTLNNFGFRRTRAPYVVETAASYGIRQAVTGALFMMGADGTTTLSDGFLDSLHLGPDYVGLTATDDEPSDNPFANPAAFYALIQLDKQNKLLTLEVQGKSKMVLGTDLDGIGTSGRFFVQASGGAISEHVATVEGVVNLIHNVLLQLGLAMVAVGVPPVSVVGAFLVDPAIAAFINAALPVAGTSTVAPFISAIQGALAAKSNNSSGLLPSVGSPGFLTG